MYVNGKKNHIEKTDIYDMMLHGAENRPYFVVISPESLNGIGLI